MDNASSPAPNERVLTVAHLIDSFDAHYSVLAKCGQVEPATVEWYRSQFVKLRTAAGNFPAAELRAHHLVAVDFTYHFVRAIKSLWKWGVEELDLPKNPFLKLKTPPCGQRNRVLTRPEMVRLYRSVSALFRRFLFISAHTMTRPGELRALRWSDVRLDARLILLTRFKGKGKRRDGAMVRPIPLDRPTARMLANFFRRKKPGMDDHVFVSPRTGRPWSKNAIVCRMRAARVKAGLNAKGAEKVVCYTLRHTGATNATRSGIRDNALARIMGHTSTRTTARYQHLDAEDLVRIIDQAAGQRPG